jgi:hypothetical protein
MCCYDVRKYCVGGGCTGRIEPAVCLGYGMGEVGKKGVEKRGFGRV